LQEGQSIRAGKLFNQAIMTVLKAGRLPGKPECLILIKGKKGVPSAFLGGEDGGGWQKEWFVTIS